MELLTLYQDKARVDKKTETKYHPHKSIDLVSELYQRIETRSKAKGLKRDQKQYDDYFILHFCMTANVLCSRRAGNCKRLSFKISILD